MARCDEPDCVSGYVWRVYTGLSGNPKPMYVPCPRCWGSQQEHCCDGPVGGGCELPSDPNQRKD